MHIMIKCKSWRSFPYICQCHITSSGAAVYAHAIVYERFSLSPSGVYYDKFTHRVSNTPHHTRTSMVMERRLNRSEGFNI